MFRLRMDEFKIYDTGLKVITLIGHLNIHWFCYNYGFSAKSPILILQNLIGIKKKIGWKSDLRSKLYQPILIMKLNSGIKSKLSGGKMLN